MKIFKSFLAPLFDEYFIYRENLGYTTDNTLDNLKRLLSGHNIGDVSYQLGHSSIKITYDNYGHWLPGEFKSEVDELDNLHLTAPYTHPKPESSKNVVLFQG